MLSWIAEHRWALLIGAEVVFWLTLIGFFVLRYLFNLQKISAYVLIVTLLNELWIVVLGIIDFRETGQFSPYQIIILLAVLYTITSGKKAINRLDRFVQTRIANWKGQPLPENANTEPPLTGKAHAHRERIGWLKHLGLYVAVHAVFLFLYGYDFTAGAFRNETADQVNKIWSTVLVVDFAISFSYTIWPKQPKKTSHS